MSNENYVLLSGKEIDKFNNKIDNIIICYQNSLKANIIKSFNFFEPKMRERRFFGIFPPFLSDSETITEDKIDDFDEEIAHEFGIYKYRESSPKRIKKAINRSISRLKKLKIKSKNNKHIQLAITLNEYNRIMSLDVEKTYCFFYNNIY